MIETATEHVEKPFLNDVSDLARTVELTVRDLRLNVHPLDFCFADMNGIGPYKTDFKVVEQVAETYLRETGAADYVFKASRNPNDTRRRSEIMENTSFFKTQVNAWKSYYSKKSTADFLIKNMQKNLDTDVGDAVDLIARAEQMQTKDEDQLRQNIARRVDNEFFAVISGVWREVYDSLNVKENPDYLYTLAFTALVEKHGWHQKTGNELHAILREHHISVKEFEWYTGRNVHEEEEEKVRAQPLVPVIIQPLPSTIRSPSPAFTNADDAVAGAMAVADGRAPVPRSTITSGDSYLRLTNIECVDADGNIFEQYPELYIATDVVRKEDQQTHRAFNPYHAMVHFESQGNGLFVPSFALSCGILDALYQHRTLFQADQILRQYKNHGAGWGWHAQNTVVNWGTQQVIHYPHDTDFPNNGGTVNVNQHQNRVAQPFDRTGFEDKILSEALAIPNFNRYIRNLTGRPNPAVLGEIAQYLERTPWVWVSKSDDVKAAWLGCDGDNFVLIASGSLYDDVAVRGVHRGRCKNSSGVITGISEFLKSFLFRVMK